VVAAKIPETKMNVSITLVLIEELPFQSFPTQAMKERITTPLLPFQLLVLLLSLLFR